MSDAHDAIVFSTKWFKILSRPIQGSAHPQYLITSNDFVVVVAVTTEGKLLLVRQFRMAADKLSLELPSGHVEQGETPEEAARKELLEETGHVAEQFELLSTSSPCIGRYTNRMWCYFAADARPTDDPNYQVEAGMEPVLYAGTVRSLMSEPDFISSLTHSALFRAVARGKLELDRKLKH